MIEQQVSVVDIKGNTVCVEAQRISACHHCSSQTSCGTALLADKFNRRSSLFIDKTMEVEVGDQVVVGIEERDLLTASFFTYMLPILVLVIVLLILSQLTDSQASISGVSVSLLILMIYLQYRYAKWEPNVVLLRKEIAKNERSVVEFTP